MKTERTEALMMMPVKYWSDKMVGSELMVYNELTINTFQDSHLICFSLIRTMVISNCLTQSSPHSELGFPLIRHYTCLFLHTLHKHCELRQFNFGERRSSVTFTYEYRCFRVPIWTSKLKLRRDSWRTMYVHAIYNTSLTFNTCGIIFNMAYIY
jgi:hypothetical protein